MVSEHVEDNYQPLAVVYPEVIPVKNTYTFDEHIVNEEMLKNVQSDFLWRERTIFKHVPFSEEQ